MTIFDSSKEAYLEIEKLISKTDYRSWSEEDVWQVFSWLLSRSAPLPDFHLAVQDYRDEFTFVYNQVISEHEAVFWRYFRAPDGTPYINPMNLDHLTRLLYLFMRRLVNAKAPVTFLDCLFFSMRTHCGLNLFYHTEIDTYFFPQHALSAVIGYGTYGKFLQISQNCTFGQNHNKYPSIGDGVIMGANSMVLGNCRIGNNVFVAAGAIVVDRDIPDDTIVIGTPKDQTIKENNQDNRASFFDLAHLSEATGNSLA